MAVFELNHILVTLDEPLNGLVEVPMTISHLLMAILKTIPEIFSGDEQISTIQLLNRMCHGRLRLLILIPQSLQIDDAVVCLVCHLRPVFQQCCHVLVDLLVALY